MDPVLLGDIDILMTNIDPLIQDFVRNETRKLHGFYGSEHVATWIVTGGKALEQYFNDIPELITKDYDIKLVYAYDKEADYPYEERLDMVAFFVYNLTKKLNAFMRHIQVPLKNHTFGKEHGDFFYIWHGGADPNSRLKSVCCRLNNNETHTSTILAVVDVYIPDAETPLPRHYNTFTPNNKGSILSRDAGDFYIPIIKIAGINYAALGYIIWDLLFLIGIYQQDIREERNVRIAKEKIIRYREKFNAITYGLCDPNKQLSCAMMREYVRDCNIEHAQCHADTLIKDGIRVGLLPEEYAYIYHDLDPLYVCKWYPRLKAIYNNQEMLENQLQ